MKPRRTIAGIVGLLAAAVIAAACGVGDEEQGGGAEGVEVPFGTVEWQKTDFSNSSVPLEEFRSGGPPKDGIPAIDEPKLISVTEADEFLEPREPVAVVEVEGEVRAYPIQILTWHEIVNDEIAGEPVSVTFCPLCNSTVAFSREVDGRVLDFGTTGKLRNSDLVMYDRQTESWWQQLTAEAVVGELTGEKLDLVPSQILSWRQLQQRAPNALVLSRDTGFSRSYGANPYAGYDDAESNPFLFEGELDERLPPKERVTAIQTGPDSAQVYPFSRLASDPAVEDDLDGEPIVVLYDPEVASPLDDAQIAEGDDAGAAAAFERRLDDRKLSFEPADEPGRFRDAETGSLWDVSGRAIEGELEGERLRQVPSDDQFWFALAAFFPEAEIRD